MLAATLYRGESRRIQPVTHTLAGNRLMRTAHTPILTVLLAACLTSHGCAQPGNDAPDPTDVPAFQIREGYAVDLVVDGLRGARFM